MMSYASRNLIPGESIVYTARLSRLRVWAWLLLAVLVAIGLPMAFHLSSRSVETGSEAGLIVALIPCAMAAWAEWGLRSRELVLTNKRLLLKTGKFSVNVEDIPLNKIQAVHYSQGVFQRIAGYGTVEVQSAGMTAREVLTGVVNPRLFQNAALGQIQNPSNT
jgi:membrane protein YdbS with pleckstrin-like domain